MINNICNKKLFTHIASKHKHQYDKILFNNYSNINNIKKTDIVGLSIIVYIIYSIKMSQLSGFVSQISSEYLFNYRLVLVIEEFP